MSLCQSCGESVAESAQRCPACGQAVDNSYPCEGCGFPVRSGMTRCSSCGRYLGKPYTYGRREFQMKSDVDIRPGGAALGVPFDTDSPLFSGMHRSNRVLSVVTRPRKRNRPVLHRRASGRGGIARVPVDSKREHSARGCGPHHRADRLSPLLQLQTPQSLRRPMDKLYRHGDRRHRSGRGHPRHHIALKPRPRTTSTSQRDRSSSRNS